MQYAPLLLGPLLLLFLGLWSGRLVSQEACSGTLTGVMMDEHDNEVLGYATVYLLEEGRGVEADADGRFAVDGLCPGTIRLRFSHIGCEPKEMSLSLTGDTTLTVYLHHHDNYTETVTVTSAGASIGYERQLDRQSDRQIGEVLEELVGISSLRTGTAAAKPVYDGLYGNRLSIQNNGIAQSGQQWGNDHAPEIDPWVAAYVQIVEGVDALRYGGSTLGPTVLVEPAPLTPRTEADRRVAYGFRSNGLGNTLNARMTDSAFVAYRLSGTLKLAGDQRTPDYHLTNTGHRESNLALQLAKFITPRLTVRTYYSLFNAEIGVLRGSHIGNLSDLEEAIGREEPFFTEPSFSYTLGSPRQRVTHHLLKGELEYDYRPHTRYTLRYGGQVDNRREFDVRRGDDDRAALELVQLSHFVEGAYHHELSSEQTIEAGLQLEAVTNTNQPGTGVMPLIPNYDGRRYGGYATYHRDLAPVRYHFGVRYDQQYFNALRISRDLPRRVESYTHHFHALGGSAGASTKLGSRLVMNTEITYRERAPQINELYSQGLHQGVSGIEEGDSSLSKERSTKVSLGLHFTSGNGHLTVIASAFVQRVANFINLEPQEDFRLTIRGAFPVFRYRGVDASLLGAKFTVLAQLGALEIDSRLALLRGQNRTDELALVFMPPTNWRTQLTYSLSGDYRLALTSLWVMEQGRVVPAQDFLAAPPGYALFDLSIGRDLQLGKRQITVLLAAENLLNQAYRDYLDRQRYFADAPGRSINFRLGYSW